jgi:hypothetical protein
MSRKHWTRWMSFSLILILLPVTAHPTQAQDAPKCYVLHEVQHVGPLDPNTVLFSGTGDVFTMIYKAEYDGKKASYPNAKWTIDARKGTARYEQPEPPATMELEFTPGPGSWCAGDEKRFALTTRPTSINNLRFRHTPRYNYSTITQLTTVTGTNPFENVVIAAEQVYAGEGGLRLLNAVLPEMKIEFLIEGGFGVLIIEYRYKQGDSVAPSPTQASSSTLGNALSGNTLVFSIMSIFISGLVGFIIFLFLRRT